ncbi:Trifunctional nucleotide phosphoesterase protein YfkN precursor [compost metagenome]
MRGPILGSLALLLALAIAPAAAADVRADAASSSAVPNATESALPASASVALGPVALEPEPLETVLVPKPKSVLILHTNDTYGIFEPVTVDPYSALPRTIGGLPRQAVAIVQAREDGSPTLLLSAGNILGPGATSAHTQGKAIVQALNRMGYDAWLPSNHDFSYGIAALKARIQDAKFPVVLANVLEKKTGKPLAKPYALFERDGVKIAVLGLTDARSRDYLSVDEADLLTFENPNEAAAKWVKIIKEQDQADLIVALTHLSLDQEMPLLAADSGIDLVVGGFNSTDPKDIAVHQVAGIDGKRALHAGGYGTMLGKARLTLDQGPGGRYRIARIEPDLLRLDEEQIPAWHLTTKAPEIVTLTFEARRNISDAWKRDNEKAAELEGALSANDAMQMVANIMRETARSEASLIQRAHFHDGGAFGQVTSARSLYYLMPWEDPLVAVQVKGSVLTSLAPLTKGSRPKLFSAGLGMVGDEARLNGRAIKADAYYLVAVPLPVAQGKVPGLTDLLNEDMRRYPATVRQSVLNYLRAQGALGKKVSLKSFPDFRQIPFWRSTLILNMDMTRRSVEKAGDKYPDLSWKGDRSGFAYGGDMDFKVGAAWGVHDVKHGLALSYRTDQLADGKTQISSDRIQYSSDYQADVLFASTKPFVNLTMTTRFVQDKSPKFFLGQLGGGLSHDLSWLGLTIREGVEHRRHFLDRDQQPDRTGATVGVVWKKDFGFFSLREDLKLFSTLDLEKEGILTDSETELIIPLTKITAISYKVNLYKNTLFPDWANRHLLGLSFRFNQPWVF